MKRVTAVLLLLSFSAPLRAAGHGYAAQYVGGTISAFEKTSNGDLETTGETHLVFRTKRHRVLVPYERVNLLEYGQKVDRRYMMAVLISPVLLLSKKRQHFLSVGYTDEAGNQQALVLRVEKDKIRAALVSLEVRTGRKVQYQDEEARKAGKG